MMKRVVALEAALLLGTACAGTEPPPNARPGGEATSSPEDELPTGCQDAKGTATVAIAAVDNEFEPFIVSADQRFRVTNEGISKHSFTIRETAIDLPLGPGERGTTGAIGDEIAAGSGEQEFFCTFHPSMVGYFAVE